MHQHDHMHFINIDPAPTMLLFLDCCRLKGHYSTEDYFEQTLKELGLKKPAVPIQKRIKRAIRATGFKANKYREQIKSSNMNIFSNTWKVMKGIALALRVLLRPNNGIFALIELGNVIEDIKASSIAADIIMQDPESRKLITERYSKGLPELSTLAIYPNGTLGKALYLHLIRWEEYLDRPLEEARSALFDKNHVTPLAKAC